MDNLIHGTMQVRLLINNLNNIIMANPKLDFFRFKLKHKSSEYKTFRDFMLESGNAKSKTQTLLSSISCMDIS